MLLETDMKFIHGDRMTIIHQEKIEIEELQIDHDVHGTVRWGLSANHSLMGLYYFGIELDEVLPINESRTITAQHPGSPKSLQGSNTLPVETETRHADMIESKTGG